MNEILYGDISNFREPHWESDKEPAMNKAIMAHQMHCPFCGRLGVTCPSYDNIWDDNLRRDLCCQNPDCAAREFVILALRTDPGDPVRADAMALSLIDEGKFIIKRLKGIPESKSMAEMLNEYVSDDELLRRRQEIA